MTVTNYTAPFGKHFTVFVSTIVLFSLVSFPIIAQERSRNAIYVDGATRGPVYSLNYDRILREGDRLSWGIRGGFSFYDNSVAFPIGVNFLTGQNEHHAEFSLCIIPFIDKKPALGNDDGSDKYIFVNPSIGYRYQAGKGLFLKIAAGPSIFLDPPSNDFWKMDPKFYAFASLGAGFSF